MDQQLSSRLFQLPAELRLHVLKFVAPPEVVLPGPRELAKHRIGCIEEVSGFTASCRRARYEAVELPLPDVRLRLPSLDAEANAALDNAPRHLLPFIKTIVIQSPNWVVRPDRFQWSSDQASLRFEAANRFLSNCVNLRLLLIEVNGQSFSGLVNATLRQLEPLKVRKGVKVEIEVSKGLSPNRAMGPTQDTIAEVLAAIRGE